MLIENELRPNLEIESGRQLLIKYLDEGGPAPYYPQAEKVINADIVRTLLIAAGYVDLAINSQMWGNTRVRKPDVIVRTLDNDFCFSINCDNPYDLIPGKGYDGVMTLKRLIHNYGPVTDTELLAIRERVLDQIAQIHDFKTQIQGSDSIPWLSLNLMFWDIRPDGIVAFHLNPYEKLEQFLDKSNTPYYSVDGLVTAIKSLGNN